MCSASCAQDGNGIDTVCMRFAFLGFPPDADDKDDYQAGCPALAKPNRIEPWIGTRHGRLMSRAFNRPKTTPRRWYHVWRLRSVSATFHLQPPIYAKSCELYGLFLHGCRPFDEPDRTSLLKPLVWVGIYIRVCISVLDSRMLSL